jgi:hypothetical protein
MRRLICEVPTDAKPVPGWESYRITAGGRVFGPRCELRVKLARGYRWVTIHDRGRSWTVKIGRLILEAFVGPASGRLVRHLDDEKLNDQLDNLAYGTARDNAEDARRNGKLLKGEMHGRAIITEEVVRLIRSMKASGATYAQITERTGIKKSHASHIVTRRLWRHVL